MKAILSLVLSLLAFGVRADGDSALAQQFTEYDIPFGINSIGAIATGPDGALWYGRTNHVGRMTTGGVITAEYQIPAGNGVTNITRGPGQTLWYSDFFGNYIGRVTTSGAITVFALPRTMSQPDGITAGPDGAIWFTEFHSDASFINHIGRITNRGVITEYPIPTASVFPQAITAGPDGALWFTESGAGGHGIGRITTSGDVAEFPISDGNQFTSIITGPDGALWFTDNERNTIYRMTTDGSVTEFLLPNPFSGPLHIIKGLGQTLWFTEPGTITGNGNRLGRITTSGTITEFTIPTNASYPNGITLGPDRAIWFTESAAGKIGRFGP